MTIEDFYRDEFPKPTDDPDYTWNPVGGGGAEGGGAGDGSVSWGESWTGGSGGGDGEVEIDIGEEDKDEDDKSEIWYLLGGWDYLFPYMLTDGSGLLQTDKNGTLLFGKGPCLKLEIYGQIEGDPSGKHKDCVLLRAFVGDAEIDPEGGLLEVLKVQKAEITIKAKWQTGHYDISQVCNVRFKVGEEVTNWFVLPAYEYVDICTIVVNGTSITLKK